jgi:hypothetical protein
MPKEKFDPDKYVSIRCKDRDDYSGNRLKDCQIDQAKFDLELGKFLSAMSIDIYNIETIMGMRMHLPFKYDPTIRKLNSIIKKATSYKKAIILVTVLRFRDPPILREGTRVFCKRRTPPVLRGGSLRCSA